MDGSDEEFKSKESEDIRLKTRYSVGASNGDLFWSKTHKMQPIDHTSVFFDVIFSLSISGAQYKAVPTKDPMHCVSSLTALSEAEPKSQILKKNPPPICNKG